MSEIKFNADEGELIKTIQGAVAVEILDVPADKYVTRPVDFAPRRKLVEPLQVASLTGLTDYINERLDIYARPGTFVHVVSPEYVSVFSQVQTAIDRRFQPIYAKADTPTLLFDRYLPKEEAIIMLQSRFVETDEQQDLLMKLGNLVASEELGQEDDGVTQSVMTQRGLKRTEEKISNPVMLRPFRTFTEVNYQPESPFIVRIRKDDDMGITVALFEADGGAWRNDARRLIKRFIDATINVDLEVAGAAIPVIA